MNTLKTWILLIFFATAIPVIGLISSFLVSHGYEKKYENAVIMALTNSQNVDPTSKEFLEKIKLDNICREKNLNDDFTATCNQYNQMRWLGYASKAALWFFIAALLIISIFGKISMGDRKAIFYLFRPGLFISQIVSATLVVANSVILIASIYFLEAFYIERVHVILIGFLGLAAAYAAYSVCEKALKPIKSAEIRVLGKLLPRDSGGKIWNFIESIAKQVGTTPPDHIVIGIEPNFFVTETKVTCLDGEVKGKTLFLSLSFCRILTQPELAAIVGHELAHFVGEDTLWSTKFYPIYRGSLETIYTIYCSSSSASKTNLLVRFAFMPALYFMNFFMATFAKVEKEIGREREINADAMGVKITSAETMAKSLLKVHVYVQAWSQAHEKVKAARSQRKEGFNLFSLLHSLCELVPTDFMKDEIGKSSSTHPTDSHPPLLTRLNAMDIQLLALYENGLQLPATDVAIDLIEDSSTLEDQLSLAWVNS